jgi:chorismate dehydratase
MSSNAVMQESSHSRLIPFPAGEGKCETITARVGVVSFLNTVPFIDGLEHLRDIQLRQSVPSGLIELLLNNEVDLALCSSIDYQLSPRELLIVPAGLLGCDGATLTVRLYSTTPIHKLARIHCDSDSHTSTILMRILLREVYEIDPAIVEYDARERVAENRPIEWPEAMLLIGDKVVTDSPPAVRYPHQLDLGAAWANLTGLPFVFAAWMMRADGDAAAARLAGQVLDRQRRGNAMRLESIVCQHARARGWPGDLALDYLRDHIAFEWTDSRQAGLEKFFAMAHAHALSPRNRPLQLLALS